MNTDILINVDRAETRIAVIEDNRLVELLIERVGQDRMVGDIHIGSVQAVVQGMQAAFVDIGIEKAGFLHVSDHRDAYVHSYTDEPYRSRRMYPIEQVLTENRDLMVQVVKEPFGSKGVRLTTFISIPGKYCVLVPEETTVGISRKITDPDERMRLKDLASSLVPEGYGLIVRTMAEGISQRDLAEDISYLLTLWKDITARLQGRRGPYRMYRAMSLELAVVRDLFGTHVDRLITDSKSLYRNILKQLNGYSRSLRDRVEVYEDELPLFEYYDIESDIDDLFNHSVRLPNGGSITIEQTEALVVIDVNTAGYAGGQNQEDTVFRTNIEAVDEIARQLRLRDLGGIIVVDFIDMLLPEHRGTVFERLVSAVKRDRANTRILPISEFGLVEMTRERIRPSLLDTLLSECPRCGGSGAVVSLLSSAISLQRRLRAMEIRGISGSSLEIMADLIQFLEEEWSDRWRIMRRQLKDIRIAEDHSHMPPWGFLIHEGVSMF